MTAVAVKRRKAKKPVRNAASIHLDVKPTLMMLRRIQAWAKLARKVYGWSISEAANRADVHWSTYSNFEGADTRFPRWQTVVSILVALGATVTVTKENY